MNETNAVIGELDEPITLPKTRVEERDLAEEKKMAKYSRTDEYKRLKNFLEDRIKFFQTFLPDGRPVKEAPGFDLEMAIVNWKSANIVIDEFQSVLNAYEQAREAVDEREVV